MNLPRIHVLGLGSIGTFAAHCLAEIAKRPPVTLLLHRSSLLQAYNKNGNKINLTTRDGQVQSHGQYDLEVLDKDQWYKVGSSPVNEDTALDSVASDSIDYLILSVKATQTVKALQTIRPRLTNQSTILFLQNGSGMMEDANTHLFPIPDTRPNYMRGIISHGVGLTSPFNITHTGPSATSIGMVPRSNTCNDISGSQNPLLKILPQSPTFNATAYDASTILQIQLEKLAVNAWSNPICALNDAPTKFLFKVPHLRRPLIQEISNVILALPELKDVPGIHERFSADALEETVANIIVKNAETTCSMVWDLRAGKETEILYINGYWSRRGKEVGVPTPLNDELVRLVLERSGQKR